MDIPHTHHAREWTCHPLPGGFQLCINQQDLDRISNLVTDMINKIAHVKSVDLGATLSQWQTEDLHRHRPLTMRSRAKGRATTVIRQHSLYEMQASAREQRKVKRVITSIEAGKRVRRKSFAHLRFQQKSTRPILRAELLHLLSERMHPLLKDKLQWKSGHHIHIHFL
jgi:hypothetical protein